ncbi:small ribosomal subunit protein mS34-like [Eurosta solidaginis]|uniref:small ribosomal subunit protein mS34-like n=1 Tax=Eurosta solidaginis TaxID=178769 RepID=UPI003530CC76
MSVIKYIGRTTDFRGNTLWELVGNLRDFGVGRLVIRNMFQRYEEPCYMRILKVDVKPHDPAKDPIRKVAVTVEKVWRGVVSPKPVTIYRTSYKPDYELVPKEEESKYLNNTKKVSEQILATEVEFPPLFREFIRQETGVEEPKMKVHYKLTPNKRVRLAKEGEKPTIKCTMGLGTPASPKLYEGIAL